jgi:hypothetical protein
MVVTSCQWFHVQVGSKNLMGILLCVFAKKRLMPFIADFHDAATGVGLMGMVGAVCYAVLPYCRCTRASAIAVHAGQQGRRVHPFPGARFVGVSGVLTPRGAREQRGASKRRLREYYCEDGVPARGGVSCLRCLR